MSDRALRLQGSKIIDPVAHHMRMIEIVAQEADEFDVVHFHVDYLHFPITRHRRIRAVTTLHGRLDIPDLAPLYREFDEMNLVSISDAQRMPFPWANWVGTVHHGLPPDDYTLNPSPGKYLAFLGRICKDKGPDRAIEIAKRTGVPIKIAAKLDDGDAEYFNSHVRGLLNDPLVEYVGEIGGRERDEFLGNACALLFPIEWPEPFGLVMIEAMACGTPVIACNRGSVPEIVEDGINGFIVNDVDSAVKAVERLGSIQRTACRRSFEERFSAERMTRDYTRIYRRLAARREHFSSYSTLGAA